MVERNQAIMQSDRTYPRVLEAGDSALRVEFGDRIDRAVNDRCLDFAASVEREQLPGVIEVVPTYRSVTLYVDPLQTDLTAVEDRLRNLLAGHNPQPRPAGRLVEIPVLYGGECGPDLAEVAAFGSCTESDVIALHTSQDYRCYMLGFAPGFPYLGSVPSSIAMPRCAEPRRSVAAGSVGIAGPQTGIYPQASPGGWRIIGRTPRRLYDPTRAQPFAISPGDTVRFVSIDQTEYERSRHAH